MASMGTLQGMGYPLRGGEDLTQVLPDQRIEWLRRAVPRITTVVMLRVDGLDGTTAHVLAMYVLRRARKAC
jgi:hypothetical protein